MAMSVREARQRFLRWSQIAMVVVLVLAVPVGVAAYREHQGARARVAWLEHLPFTFGAFDDRQCDQAAAREHVIIARLGMTGATLYRTKAVFPAFEPGGPTLDEVDAEMPPWPAREEVRAAIGGNVRFGCYRSDERLVELLTLAQPVPEGGALYIVTGAHLRRWRAPLAALGGLEGGLALFWLLNAALLRWRLGER